MVPLIKTGNDLRRAKEEIESPTDYLLTSEEYKAIQLQINQLKKINESLMRINKERSNAERRLAPKKVRYGYLVLHSSERKVSGGWGRTGEEWQTDIETPFPAAISEKFVRYILDQDLFENSDMKILNSIGITRVKFMDQYYASSREEEKENVLYKYMLRANYKTNYWEVSIYHTKSIVGVPQELRPNIYIKREVIEET